MRSSLLLLLTCIPFIAAAQKDMVVISGTVANQESNEAIKYAVIYVFDAEGKKVGAGVSMDSGEFSVTIPQTGEYTLQVSRMGYKIVNQTITADGKALKIGKIALKEGIDLEPVVITSLLREESDRLIYDVSADPDALTNSIMTIMQKIPGLKIDPERGRLRYNGRGVDILVDGRDDEMINDIRQYPMEFIKGHYMDKIEVIMPGSPEYNNELPIINIKLDRPLPIGFAGQLSPAATTRGTYSAELDMVAKTSFTGLGFNYKPSYSKSPKVRSETNRESLLDDADYRTMENASESWSEYQNHNLALDIFRPFLKDKLRVGINTSTSLSNGDSYADASSSNYNDAGALTKGSSSHSHTHSYSPMRLNAGLNAYHIHKLGSMSLGYTYSDSRSESTQDTRLTTLGAQDVLRKSEANSGSATHSVTFGSSIQKKDLDWTFAVSGNYINRLYDNASQYYYYDDLTGEYVADQTRYDGMHYRQQVASLTTMVLPPRLFKKRLSISARLNGEYEIDQGTYRATGTPIDYDEFNVVPYIRLIYGKKVRTNLSYTGKVRRPGLKELNPYVDDSDPENLRTGNPDLKGEYNHNLSLSLGFGSSLLKSLNWPSLSYGISLIDNPINRVSYITDQNVSVTTYRNLGREVRHRAGASWNLPKIGKAVTVLVISAYYNYNYYSFPSGETNTNQSLTGNVLARFFDIVQAEYTISPAFSGAQNRGNSYYQTLNLSASYYFKKIKVGGSVGVDDALNSNKMVREETFSTQFNQVSYHQRTGRTFRFSLYWRFGWFQDIKRLDAVESGIQDSSR